MQKLIELLQLAITYAERVIEYGPANHEFILVFTTETVYTTNFVQLDSS